TGVGKYSGYSKLVTPSAAMARPAMMVRKMKGYFKRTACFYESSKQVLNRRDEGGQARNLSPKEKELFLEVFNGGFLIDRDVIQRFCGELPPFPRKINDTIGDLDEVVIRSQIQYPF
ncbi:MAG: hypothetical protein ACI94D_002581, partial [Neolewinella sp.]